MAERYPTQEDLAHMSPREVLAEGQIERTPHHGIAISWLHEAWILGEKSDVASQDPSLLGETAVLLAIRSELARHPISNTEYWLTAASMELTEPGIPRREQAAVAIAACRIAALRLYHGVVEEIDLNRAREWSDRANHHLRAEHSLGGPWDRYATMLDKHRSLAELLDNKSPAAARFALRGIWRATQAEREGQPPHEHQVFVREQQHDNAHILRLAVSPHLPNTYIAGSSKEHEVYDLLGRPFAAPHIMEYPQQEDYLPSDDTGYSI